MRPRRTTPKASARPGRPQALGGADPCSGRVIAWPHPRGGARRVLLRHHGRARGTRPGVAADRGAAAPAFCANVRCRREAVTTDSVRLSHRSGLPAQVPLLKQNLRPSLSGVAGCRRGGPKGAIHSGLIRRSGRIPALPCRYTASTLRLRTPLHGISEESSMIAGRDFGEAGQRGDEEPSGASGFAHLAGPSSDDISLEDVP